MKNSNDIIENRTRDLPDCSAMFGPLNKGIKIVEYAVLLRTACFIIPYSILFSLITLFRFYLFWYGV